MIRVLNIHTDVVGNIIRYIGRGSPLGNPYTSIKGYETKALYLCESREESVKLYREYLLKKIEEKDKEICDELNHIYESAKKGDIDLVCFCRPLLCHGYIIKDLVQSRIKRNEGNFS